MCACVHAHYHCPLQMQAGLRLYEAQAHGGGVAWVEPCMQPHQSLLVVPSPLPTPKKKIGTESLLSQYNAP